MYLFERSYIVDRLAGIDSLHLLARGGHQLLGLHLRAHDDGHAADRTFQKREVTLNAVRIVPQPFHHHTPDYADNREGRVAPLGPQANTFADRLFVRPVTLRKFFVDDYRTEPGVELLNLIQAFQSFRRNV